MHVARWAHRRHFLSVCLSVKEIQTRIKFISRKVLQVSTKYMSPYGFLVGKVLSKKMHVTCANHKVGSLPTSSCIFGNLLVQFIALFNTSFEALPLHHGWTLVALLPFMGLWITVLAS